MAIRLLLNIGDAQQVILTLEQRLQDMTPAMVQIKEVLLDSVRQNFDASGRPDAWAPLKYRAGIPLSLTGRLKGSITGEVTPTSVTVGTNLAYAPVHQYGATFTVPAMTARTGSALHWTSGGRDVFARSTRAHSVTIPARPFMVVQSEDVETMRSVLLGYLMQGVS